MPIRVWATRLLRAAIAVVLFAAMLTASGGMARAAMEPDNVAKVVEDAAKECTASGGKPDTDAMLTVDDLNGDGGEDWIVDFAKLKCDGAVNPFCGTGGCTLQVFLWTGGAAWKSVFDETVRSYRVVKRAPRGMEFELGGAACNKPNYQRCKKTFLFRGKELRAR